MLGNLTNREKVVGVKQSRRAVREGRADRVFLAINADPALTDPLEELCAAQGVSVDRQHTMEELGRAAGIQVGAAVVVVLKA